MWEKTEILNLSEQKGEETEIITWQNFSQKTFNNRNEKNSNISE